MTTLNGRSAVHISCMMVMVMMALMAMIATASPSAWAPAQVSPSASLFSRPFDDHHREGVGQHAEIHPPDMVEDYSIWDPAPRSGGGDYAPIPHAE
ncbi:hypothetical protein OIU76_001380 [Salix suchowensis]|uniref:Secreted protein n=2 Tax=Salix TaxID=40685 RepID=A0A9Q0SL53_9ROSI|nr:hypothetical protein IMY05_005G0186300 [Salix suchowensis]KAJ6352153.1 hypothetical protein OIU76_001380 [Salix suchowensis]KAJ6399550.1 hypothetical protein OIU77_020165 [Salix suchowensis]KAJ6681090.1 hypothetical protein OIU74_019548 [Salix koriyanagi]